MTSNQLKTRNELVNWDVAPAEHEIGSYDDYKLKYRKMVEDMILPIANKSLKKKTFITISTNVLCADIHSSADTVEPIVRDIYLPLEISLTKWSVAQGKEDRSVRNLNTTVWMINPGRPTKGSNCYSMEHTKKHKIAFDLDDADSNPFIEQDLTKVMREINNMLLPDRTVFSLELRLARQDLGALKWLNRETDSKTKPIKVLSLEDLYVVMVRKFNPEKKHIVGQGLAHHRMSICNDAYNPDLQCEYHQALAKDEEGNGDCAYCSKALSHTWTDVLLNDLKKFTNIYDESSSNSSPVKEKKAPIASVGEDAMAPPQITTE